MKKNFLVLLIILINFNLTYCYLNNYDRVLKLYSNQDYYNFTNELYNRKQIIYIKINNIEELRESLLFSKLINKRVSIRSGGHSSCSYSVLDDTVNLDLSGLKDIKVNKYDNTTIAQSGVLMDQFYSEITKYGLVSPGGSCPSVGLGGIALGGGTNYLAPKYGYLVDNIIDFTVLLQNGEVVKANKTNCYKDLYWALAGSGHGGFGIVIDFKIKLYPSLNYYYINNIKINNFEKEIVQIMKQIDHYVNNAADYIQDKIYFGFFTYIDKITFKIITNIKFFYNGDLNEGENEFKNILNNYLNLFDIFVNTTNYEYVKKEFINIIKSVKDDTGRNRQFTKSRFLKDLNETRGETFKYIMMEGMEIYKNKNLNFDNKIFISGEIYYHGGKQSRKEINWENSFVHRGEDYKWTVVFTSKYGNSKNDYIFLNYKNQINQLLPIFGNKIYQNYPDDDIDYWQNAYYSSYYSKLQQIKLKYDPYNYFKYQQSIELPY